MKELKDFEYKEFKTNKQKIKKVIYFYSDYAVKSLLIKEDLEEIEKLYNKEDNVYFFKVNVSFNPEFVKNFKIKNVPTIIFVNEKNIIVNILEKEILLERIIEDLRTFFPITTSFFEIIKKKFFKKIRKENEKQLNSES